MNLTLVSMYLLLSGQDVHATVQVDGQCGTEIKPNSSMLTLFALNKGLT